MVSGAHTYVWTKDGWIQPMRSPIMCAAGTMEDGAPILVYRAGENRHAYDGGVKLA